MHNGDAPSTCYFSNLGLKVNLVEINNVALHLLVERSHSEPHKAQKAQNNESLHLFKNNNKHVFFQSEDMDLILVMLFSIFSFIFAKFS